jgi:DNA-directed RNA polymerase specialized sigma24 family protein
MDAIPEPISAESNKPKLEEVLRYAQGNIRKFLGQFAADLPSEMHEEIMQTANLRIIEAYRRLEADLGWKSFVHNHARGAVLDYLKFGKGFEEGRWRLKLSEDGGVPYVEKLRERVSFSSEDQEHDVDVIAGINGVADFIDESQVKINWALLSRLARIDDATHAFAMWLRGFEAAEIGIALGVCSARVGQLLRRFVEKLNDPNSYSYEEEPYINQTIFALGLSKHFGLPVEDESLRMGFSIGWEQVPVDLDSLKPKYQDLKEDQLGLFDAI